MFWIFVYVAVWLMTFFQGWRSDVAFVILAIVSIALLLIELRFNARYLLVRIFEAFSERLYFFDLFFVFAMATILSALILFSWSWLSNIVIFLTVSLAVLSAGIAIGANAHRKEYISSTFPWDLAFVYERSLNPNIRKTYGTFIYVIVPLLTVALVVDPRLLAVAIFLQIQNIYTRVRMTIPISAFLTTGYEKSVDAWLALKRASGERSIPGLVLDKERRVPSEIAVQQDLVRIQEDDAWLTAVATVLKYCKYVVFDTHSVTEAVRQEVDFVFKSEHLKKVIFIRRPEMDPFMTNAAALAEKTLGERRLLSVEEIARIFQAERDSAMGTNTRSPLMDALIAAKAPKLRQRK